MERKTWKKAKAKDCEDCKYEPECEMEYIKGIWCYCPLNGLSLDELLFSEEVK